VRKALPFFILINESLLNS